MLSLLKVLIIDDEKEIRDTLKRMVEISTSHLIENVSIKVASSISEGLDILDYETVDIIFLDYHFEGGSNGQDFIQNLFDPFNDIFVFLVSGRSEKELHSFVISSQKKRGNATFGFIRKPLEKMQVEFAIRRSIEMFTNCDLPFPIHYAKKRYYSEVSSSLKILLLRDIVESIASITSILILSDAKENHLLSDEDVFSSNTTKLNIDKYIRILKKVCGIIADNKEKVQTYDIAKILNKNLSLFERFKNDVRIDSIAHPGATPDGAFLDMLDNTYKPLVFKLLDSLCILRRYRLFYPVSVEITDSTEKKYLYRSRLLMGDGQSFKTIIIESESTFPTQKVYVYTPYKKQICLYPYFSYEICEMCKKKRFFTLSKFTKSDKIAKYLSTCNHKISHCCPVKTAET